MSRVSDWKSLELFERALGCYIMEDARARAYAPPPPLILR